MSTHNACFYGDIRKKMSHYQIPLNRSNVYSSQLSHKTKQNDKKKKNKKKQCNIVEPHHIPDQLARSLTLIRAFAIRFHKHWIQWNMDISVNSNECVRLCGLVYCSLTSVAEWIHFQRRQLFQLWFAPLLKKGFTLKGNNLILPSRRFFPLRKYRFSGRDYVHRKTNMKLQKLSPL